MKPTAGPRIVPPGWTVDACDYDPERDAWLATLRVMGGAECVRGVGVDIESAVAAATRCVVGRA